MVEDYSSLKFNYAVSETKPLQKNVEQSVEVNRDPEHKIAIHNIFISKIYNDSEDEYSDIETASKNSTTVLSKPSSIITDYKAFELEKVLTMADHISSQHFKENTHLVPETTGFITCSNLTEDDLKNVDCKKNAKNDFNSFCIVTESEMISCCDQAEQRLEKHYPMKSNENHVVHPLSPKKNDHMELVNSILNDFSQSPLGEKQVTSFLQYTPEFRLHRKPIKNYSRKFLNSTKTNLNKRFAKHPSKVSPEYEDDGSSCSSLSIQEDVTLNENNQSEVLSLSNTQRLCENLLNLTEYFTENQSQELLLDEQQEEDTLDLNLPVSREENLTILYSIPDLIKDILTLRSTHSRRKSSDSYNSVDDFNGFLNIEDKRDALNINNSSHIIINKDINVTHDLMKVCDIQLPNELMNNEDPLHLDHLNEVDSHDAFSCTNNENRPQRENCRMPNNALQKLESVVLKSADNNFIDLEMLNENATFKVKDQMLANKLRKSPDVSPSKGGTHLTTCDIKNVKKDLNIFENENDYEWNDDCDFLLNIQTPTSLNDEPEYKPEQRPHLNDALVVPQKAPDDPEIAQTIQFGFKTAGGKNLHLSKKAQMSVQKLLDEFTINSKDCYNYEEELRKIKCTAYEKSHKLDSDKSAINDLEDRISEQGFRTAGGKDITISKSAQETVKNLLKEFCHEYEGNYEENDLEIIKQKLYNKNKKNNKSSESENRIPKPLLEFPSDKTNIPNESRSVKIQISSLNRRDKNNAVFHIAQTKAVSTSKPQKSVQRLFEELGDTSKEDFFNDIKPLQDNLNIENVENILDADIVEFNQLNESLFLNCIESVSNESVLLNVQNENDKASSTKELNRGFQTANGKPVCISTKAQQAVEKLLEEFDNFLDIDEYENNLKEMKMKLQIKNEDLSKSAQKVNKHVDIGPYKTPSSTTDANKLYQKSNLESRKRRNSADNSNLECATRTPPVKICKNNLETSTSSFAEKSLKSPLTLTVHPKILRKNLLSLTKRRKVKGKLRTMSSDEVPNMKNEMCNLHESTATPIKSCNLMQVAEHGPSTPNLEDFISNAPLTSTPRLNTTDLRLRNWTNNNDSINNVSAGCSMRTTKLSDNLGLNITLNSSNPTPKERIARLKSYGKAPPVSPILIETHHNCRPSGLRRTRSMQKKTEK